MDDAAAADGAVRRPAAVARALVFFVSVFLAAWWLIGDLSYEGRVEGGLDYMFEAPEVPAWSTAVLGIAGLALAIITGSPALRSPAARGPTLGLLASGALCGLLARVMTAGGVGANIGGGMSLIFGLPVLGVVTLGCLLLIGVNAPAGGRRRSTSGR